MPRQSPTSASKWPTPPYTLRPTPPSPIRTATPSCPSSRAIPSPYPCAPKAISRSHHTPSPRPETSRTPSKSPSNSTPASSSRAPSPMTETDPSRTPGFTSRSNAKTRPCGCPTSISRAPSPPSPPSTPTHGTPGAAHGQAITAEIFISPPYQKGKFASTPHTQNFRPLPPNTWTPPMPTATLPSPSHFPPPRVPSSASKTHMGAPSPHASPYSTSGQATK